MYKKEISAIIRIGDGDMKIQIDFDENLKEEEVIIRCNRLDSTIQEIQKAVLGVTNASQKYSFYKDGKEYYIAIEEVLFFETSENVVNAHTKDDVYKVKYRLYELEEMLPRNFLRVSKSTILNVSHIFSIDRNLTSSSIVQFYKSHKQVYVSRFYEKDLRNRLEERRN